MILHMLFFVYFERKKKKIESNGNIHKHSSSILIKEKTQQI